MSEVHLEPIHEEETPAIEADVLSPSQAKTILVLNDSHNYDKHETSANNVAELMTELGISSEMVVARSEGSDVVDFEGTPVNEDGFYSFYTRNKTGGSLK